MAGNGGAPVHLAANRASCLPLLMSAPPPRALAVVRLSEGPEDERGAQQAEPAGTLDVPAVKRKPSCFTVKTVLSVTVARSRAS